MKFKDICRNYDINLTLFNFRMLDYQDGAVNFLEVTLSCTFDIYEVNKPNPAWLMLQNEDICGVMSAWYSDKVNLLTTTTQWANTIVILYVVEGCHQFYWE